MEIAVTTSPLRGEPLSFPFFDSCHQRDPLMSAKILGTLDPPLQIRGEHPFIAAHCRLSLPMWPSHWSLPTTVKYRGVCASMPRARSCARWPGWHQQSPLLSCSFVLVGGRRQTCRCAPPVSGSPPSSFFQEASVQMGPAHSGGGSSSPVVAQLRRIGAV